MGAVVVIGGIILLWLLRKHGAQSAASGPGGTETYPDPGAVDSQPAPGDIGVPNLPDVGSLPKPRAISAQPVSAAQQQGGCNCENNSGCVSPGYIDNTAPMRVPAAYIDSAVEALSAIQPSIPGGAAAPIWSEV